MAYQEHQDASKHLSVGCAVLTLSDTRDESTDASGALIKQLLLADGHRVLDYRILREDPSILDSAIKELSHRHEIDVVLTNGGTGIGRRDHTVTVLERLIDLPLPGFGELFRALSHQQIGSGAMLSRAVGGIAGGKLIFAMPGSTKGVELAMTALILPEVRHILRELRK
jgi:molybdenum cofactor biosynthesis protein B